MRYGSFVTINSEILTMKTLLFTLFFWFTCSLSSARNFDDIEIKVIKAQKQVYMLQGSGGNIGVFSSEAGLLLVDDQFAPLAQKIEAAMKGITNNELKYIVNTHFHGDHTGSNSYFAHKAPIFAHSKVRERLNNQAVEKQVALPVVTYEQGVTIYMADEEIQLSHYPAAHTDGDTAVYFKNANVLHAGDLFFEIGFPYIDINHGGSVNGYLAAVNKLIELMPDDVVIIPGHGELANKDRYIEFANMIDYSIKRVNQFLAQGKSEQEVIALGIGKNYQHWAWRFINEEKWLKTLYSGLKSDLKAQP